MADEPVLRTGPSIPLTFVKPMVASFSPSVDAAMSRKLERGSPGVAPALMLQSPNGTFWRITVADNGQLTAQPMVRS